MAAGTNSVGIFFADGTYVHERWEDIDDLIDGRQMTLVQIMHHQNVGNPSALPNRVIFNGRDISSLFYKPTSGVLVLRSTELAGLLGNDVIRESRFAPDGSQVIEEQLELNLDEALTRFVSHGELDFNDPDYDDLGDRAFAHSLRAEAVPSSGTY